MNAGSQSCFCKGAVLNPKHAAPSVAMVGEAARLFGRFAVPSTRKVGSLAAQQRSPLLCFGFLGSHTSEAGQANLFSRFGRALMMRHAVQGIGVAFQYVFALRQAFKVFYAIVSLVTVDVVNLLIGVKRLQPAGSHSAMNKRRASNPQVSLRVLVGCVRQELSENFSAARNSVQVVEKSVLDSVYFYAQHAVPFKAAKESSF